MNKNELIEEVVEKTGLSKKDAKNALESILEVITENLIKKEPTTFLGFGTFTTAEREARTARVPGTDRTVEVPASTVVKFKIGKSLKETVSGTNK